MKKLFLAFLLVCAAALPACQCDDPPDMAPIEGSSGLVVLESTLA